MFLVIDLGLHGFPEIIYERREKYITDPVKNVNSVDEVNSSGIQNLSDEAIAGRSESGSKLRENGVFADDIFGVSDDILEGV